MKSLSLNRRRIGMALLIVGAILYLPVPVAGQITFFVSWMVLGRPISWRTFVYLFVLFPLFVLLLIGGLFHR
jgi:hypothetical protein